MKSFTKIGLVACSSLLTIALGFATSSRAAPPGAANVNVVNTPLPVTNNPATPVQFTLGSGQTFGPFYGTSYSVPANTRLVIEYMSGACNGDVNSDRVPEFLTFVGGVQAIYDVVLVPAGDTPVLPAGFIHNYHRSPPKCV